MSQTQIIVISLEWIACLQLYVAGHNKYIIMVVILSSNYFVNYTFLHPLLSYTIFFI